MLAKTPPMGFNTWNTFGLDIHEDLVKEIADTMVSEGYLEAGYEYLVIDDGWSEMRRDKNGFLVPSKEKFPSGMKALGDYIHSKGLKFGMYSCAGIKTCAGYPSSFGHEFQDAKTFAKWGVDYLKYDFCNFPESADCKAAYLTMSMALKACGREILFAACNWGMEDPGKWMRGIGAHIYRSTMDIHDNFTSFRDIAQSQLGLLGMSAPGCFNDPDMLIVGMRGKGNVGIENGCSDDEYKCHFALWCLFPAPLMIGCDIRKIDPVNKALLQNKMLIEINQDEEARPPFTINNLYSGADETHVLMKQLANNEFVFGLFNFDNQAKDATLTFSNAGIPFSTGISFDLTNVFTGENLGVYTDFYTEKLPAHSCVLLKAKFVFE